MIDLSISNFQMRKLNTSVVKRVFQVTQLVKAKTKTLASDPKLCNSFYWNTLTDRSPSDLT